MLVPIIAVLGNVAISKAFGGSGIDTTKELTALSVANICGSFVSSFPVTGSFSRSAVNHASGVKTPIGGFYTSNSSYISKLFMCVSILLHRFVLI